MTKARVLADYVASGVTAAEFDFLDVTSGTADATTFLRGDKTWQVVDTEGTGIKSTGESGGNKFLREDGDGTSSWQEAGSPSISDGGNATAITIDINEKVGIGTATPSVLLDVHGDTAVGNRTTQSNGNLGTLEIAGYDTTENTAFGRINFRQAGTGNYAKIESLSGGAANKAKLAFYTGNAATPVQHMTIDEAGNIGIGTTDPSFALQVLRNSNNDNGFAVDTVNAVDSTVAFRAAGTGYWRIGRTNSTGNLDFMTEAGARKMSIEPTNGYVGIGKTSGITEVLDVEGVIRGNITGQQYKIGSCWWYGAVTAGSTTQAFAITGGKKVGWISSLGTENNRNSGFRMYGYLWNSINGMHMSERFNLAQGNGYGNGWIDVSGNNVRYRAHSSWHNNAYVKMHSIMGD